MNPTPAPQFAADVKGCVVSDDFNHQLGDANEALLSSALFHIDNDSCPVVATSAAKQQPQFIQHSSQQGIQLTVPKSLYNTNMDLTWPSKGASDE